MLAAGVLAAGVLALWRARRFSLAPEDALIAMACAVGLGLLGGSLLYSAVTYSPEEILRLLRAGNITALLGGGLVFYGSLVAGFFGLLWGSRIAKAGIKDVMLCLLPSMPLAHAIGRIGCFLAGCCYGAPTDPRIGVAFPAPVTDAPAGVPLLPVQLVEAALNFLLCALLLRHTASRRDAWGSLWLYGGLYSGFRFVLEFWRGDGARGAWSGLSTSQWISLALILAAGLFWAWRRRRGRA